MTQVDSTVGEILRKAREAKKLTIDQAHRETKIAVNVLESLENDDYGSFVSDTYLKGFLRNYAVFLGLEPDPLWAMLSRKASAPEGPRAAYWDTEESGVHEERLSSPHIFKRFVLPLMLIVILVLTILLIREHRKVESLSSGLGVHQPPGEVTADAAEV